MIEKSGLFVWISCNLIFSYIDISLFGFWLDKKMAIKFKVKYAVIVGISKTIILKLVGYPYGACINLLLTAITIKYVLKEESKQKCFIGGLISELPKIVIDISTVGIISFYGSQASITNHVSLIYFLNLVIKLMVYHLKEILIIEKGQVKYNALEAYNENLSRTE